jgi:hypothetical protein
MGGLMVYRIHDPMLGFTFMLSFLLTTRMMPAFRG